MGLSKKERRVAKLKGIFEPEIKLKDKAPGFFEIIKRNWKGILIIFFLSAGIYANGLRGDFVSDDYATILNNQAILSTAYFRDPGVTFTGSAVVNFFVATIFGKTNPIPFHLASLILFEIVLVLSFVVIVKVYNDKIAFYSVLFFAFLPINVESVSWISGKPYLLGAVSFLLSFLAFYTWLEEMNVKNLVILTLSIIFACFCFGPRGLVVLVLFLLYWVCFKMKSFNSFLKISILLIVVVSVGSLAFYPMIANRLAVVTTNGASLWDKIYEPWFQYPTAITKYLQLLAFPFDLTLYHTMLQVIPTWLNWLIMILYFIILIYFWFTKKNGLVFAFAFIFVVSIGSMTPLKVSWMVAERYMFFGGLGFSIALAIILEQIGQKNILVKWSLLGMILLSFGYRVLKRNFDWQTNHALWVNTCQVSPNSHNAWNNIGDDYDKLKEYENAIKGFSQSTIVKNDYADAYHNRANIFFKINRLDLARDSYLTALKYNPALYQSYVALIQVAMADGKIEEAFSYGNTLLKYQPKNPLVHYIFGMLYKQIGKSDEAKKAFVRALQLDPNFSQAKLQLQSTT